MTGAGGRALWALLAGAALALAGCGSPAPQAPVPVQVIEIDEPSSPLPPTESGAVVRARYHTVVSGETLGEIAYQHGLDYRDLALWNNLANPDLIEVGQRLQLHPPKNMPEVIPLKPVQAQKPVSGASKQEIDAQAGRVTRAQIDVRGNRQRAAADLVTEPQALKIPYTEKDAERLLGQASGGAEQAALVIREGSQSANQPPGNTRELNGIVWSWPVNGQLIGAYSEDSKGIDLGGPLGQPIYASAGGEVIYAGAGLPGYGQMVVIKHTNEYLSAYAHINRMFVAEGESVERGAKIAEMGDTGTDRVKLHFEIRRGSKTFDPQQFLPRNP